MYMADDTGQAVNASALDDESLMEMGEEMMWLLVKALTDGRDHPEIWKMIPELVDKVPGLIPAMCANDHLVNAPQMDVQIAFTILIAMMMAVQMSPAEALETLRPLAAANSESPLVRGALFHILAMTDPADPEGQWRK
jgi:hypothetical protein